MTSRDWNKLGEALTTQTDGNVWANEPMSKHTSWRTGGPVRAFVEPKTPAGFESALTWVREQNIDHIILGAGSNVLWADQPYGGVVLHTETALDELIFLSSDTMKAGAGVRLNRILTNAMERGLGGFAFMYGIPGTVGGAVRMNAGTSIGSMNDVLIDALVVDGVGNSAWIDKEDLNLEYRSSNLGPGDVVLEARLKSTGSFSAEEKAALKSAKEYRRATQPLQFPSGGSVFKNPPQHKAGALIEQAQLKKRRVGGAEVSSLHANFIIQDGSATSDDIRQLIREVQAEVFRVHEVWLEPEVQFLGPWSEEDVDAT